MYKRAVGILFFALTLLPTAGFGETKFEGMLSAAKRGDSMARVVIAYAYYMGKYRDGTRVEQNYEKAYAWASLANYQGNKHAQRLLNAVIPKLRNRAAADALAGKYFKKYGARPPDRQ